MPSTLGSYARCKSQRKPSINERTTNARRRPAPSPSRAVSRLLLSRRVGESISIGDVTVEVARQSGRRTVLAVVAPRDVAIRRSEVLDRIVAAAVAAAELPGAA